MRDQFGDRLRYVFRHKPLAGDALARPAAELVERAPDAERFWAAHVKLMTRSEVLTEDDLIAVAQDLGVKDDDDPPAQKAALLAKARVDPTKLGGGQRRPDRADILHQRTPVRRPVG